MKLFTSRYSNKEIATADLVPVGISLGNPRFRLAYTVAANLRMLAPDRSTWGLKPNLFATIYSDKLDNLGFNRIKAQLEEVSRNHGGKDLVLLCFEDVWAGDWCHRRNFADWWLRHTGEEAAELPVLEPTIKIIKPAKAEKKDTADLPMVEQLTLF